jgi:hypothetical protein
VTLRQYVSHRIKALVKGFKRSNDGNVAVIFALCLIPMTIAIGMAIDYNNATTVRLKLQDYADAAVLSGVSYNAVPEGVGMVLDVDNSQSLIKSRFQRDINDPSISKMATVRPTYIVTKVNGTVTAKLKFEADVVSYFGSLILNKPTTLVSGMSEAKSSPPTYIDIIALIDNSGSMGIGADTSDQNKMQAGMGCTFACHGQEATAAGLGAELRINVVRKAFKNMVDKFQAHQNNVGEYRIAVYSFANSIKQVSPPSTDLSTVKLAVDSIGLAPPNAMGTNHTYTLRQFKNLMPLGGVGDSPTNRKLFVLLFTDGISDGIYHSGWWIWGDPNYVPFAPTVMSDFNPLQGLDARECTPVKDKNAILMTLELDYVIPAGTTDNRFIDIRDKLKPSIATNMEACASTPKYAFGANSTAEIQRATEEMYNAIMIRPRLTQ